jgi:iron complex outermembrane receptor protein
MARADVSRAELAAPLAVPRPSAEFEPEVRVELSVLVGKNGEVEAVTTTAQSPADAPGSFVDAAASALRRAHFRPSLRNGEPIRSWVESVVVFEARRTPTLRGGLAAPPAAPSASASSASVSAASAELGAEVEVRGEPLRAPRGVGDVRVDRELLQASPRQRTSELLSAAPGFFVDHEDGEGLGNDITLRGFDLEHGAGIELSLGSVPITSPIHVRGSGYADADFIIPEVVDGIQMLSGPYDPRQGDAAIVGSADFELGVAERGTQVKASYGSFNQLRLLGIIAPRESDEGTFAAVALRRTDGFGQNRSGRSGSVNAQYGVELGHAAKLRLFATAYAADSALAGVVREDDVAAGRIGYLDSYPYFAANQGVLSQRLLLGAELSRTRGRQRQRIVPFVTWTNFRARQNYAGALESSQSNPSLSGLGDLFETKNREFAAGVLASSASEHRLGSGSSLSLEPGVSLRAGSTTLKKKLLVPDSLAVWDRRLDETVATLDLGAYLDAELTLWKRLRLAGGPRVDFLSRAIDDQLAGERAARTDAAATPSARRTAAGLVVGPRLSADYALLPALSLVAAYGEGFRSLDPSSLKEGSTKPYSRVRSVETGLRVRDSENRLRSSIALFQTWVGNELVFVAENGGLETQQGSVRRGLVASLFYRPSRWFFVSTALTVTDAQFQTRVPGISHNVPNVPPVLWRADAVIERVLGVVSCRPVRGRLSVGYTLAAPAHISDQLRGPTTHALAAGATLRVRALELGVEGYNLLGLRAADSADRYASNWSLKPGQRPASVTVHTVAAPPRTVIASLGLYF